MVKQDKDNNTDMEVVNDIPPSPFMEDMEDIETSKTDEKYTRTELENRTAKELAVMASEYINANPETIAKWAKKDIITVILNKGYDKKSAPRQNRTRTDTENVIIGVLDFLDNIKEEREQKRLYKPLKDVFKNNATNVIDEGLGSGAINLNTASKVVVVVAGSLILIDSFIGLKKIPELIKNWKNKKENDRANKTESK
jgi:hypothetical protein